MKPQRLMYELSSRFPLGTRFFADIGNSFLWAIHYLLPFDRRIAGERKHCSSTFHTSMGFASMGWSIAAAIGAAVARPNQPVVCIVGDGSMLMSGNEVTVAVQVEVPVIYVILNDGAYGTVKHGQRMTGAEPIAFELPHVEFHKWAEAIGAKGVRVTSAADWDSIDVDELCARPGPTVIDVIIDGEECPPFGTRMKVLQTAPVESAQLQQCQKPKNSLPKFGMKKQRRIIRLLPKNVFAEGMMYMVNSCRKRAGVNICCFYSQVKNQHQSKPNFSNALQYY